MINYNNFINEAYNKINQKLSDSNKKNLFITGKNMSGKSDVLKKILNSEYQNRIYFIDTINRNFEYSPLVIFSKESLIGSPNQILLKRRETINFNTRDCFGLGDVGFAYAYAYGLFSSYYSASEDFRKKIELFLEEFSIKVKLDLEQKNFSTGRLCYFTIDDNLVSLSSGYQALLRIFTEIYYVQNTEINRNIFIIDELDIHLDAMMCQRIVGKLKECFPNIKIIATVHSINFFQENLEDDILMLKGYESKIINASEIGNLSSAFNIIFYQNESKKSFDDNQIKQIKLKLSMGHRLNSKDRTYIRKIADSRNKTESQKEFLEEINKFKSYVTFETILDKVYNDKQLSDLDKEFITKETDLSEEDKSIKEIILKYI